MTAKSHQPSLPGMEAEPARGSDPPVASPTPAAQDAADTAAHPDLRGAPPETVLPAVDLPPVESLAGKTVYVIDSHSLIYQVFHAMGDMTGPAGQPVGATFGFARDIVFLLDRKRPDFLICAFDLPGKTFRHEVYDRYKVSRSEMPEDLRPQIADIRRLLDAMGIPAIGFESFEADDVLATVARQVEQMGGTCVAVTADKDCRQLISENVKLYNIRKDAIFDEAALLDAWKIRPDQVVDFQALVGDPTDDIPGVPLIGPKIAAELLDKFGTLENVLDHAGEISGKKRKQNLIEGREAALLSRRLARLVDDVPIEVDWNAARVGGVDRESVVALCREWGFRSLTEQLAGVDAAAAPPVWLARYETVTDAERLAELAVELGRQKRISLDTETTAINPRLAQLVGLSFSWQEGEAYYVPVRAPAGEPTIPLETVLETLRPAFEDPRIAKVGQNLKYDLVVLRGAGITVRGTAFDTMVASYLLDAGERNHGLDDLSKRYLNHSPIAIAELIGKGKQQKCMDRVPLAEIGPYAAEDADVPLRLAPILGDRLEHDGLEDLFDTLEMPLVEVLAEMEFNGIRVDPDRLRQLSREFAGHVDALEGEIHELAGREFNIASPKQLATILFDELGLPVVKKTKTGPSTDASVLEELAASHALPAKIVEYRQYAKLKNTYVDALPELIHPETGRIHASFNQVVTATGRLSSNDPNLQNIPIRTEQGRQIRSAFLPAQNDWRLLAADYSQIELRVLAHFSGDETLVAAFADDEDIHARVAAQVYGVPLDEVTSSMRRSAKAINFGIIYGQSPFGLAKSLGIGKDEAAEFIDAYFDRYPGVDGFFTQVLTDCRRDGFVRTILGRRRAIEGVRDPQSVRDPRQRILAERTAINTVVQGSAADLIKRAMLAVHARMRRERFEARLLLQIHDELVLETPAGRVDALTELVVAEMEAAAQLAVPLKVDVGVGANWAECK